MTDQPDRIRLQIGEEGYLADPTEWTMKVAAELARREGIDLTYEHWAVIHFIRRHFERHQIPPGPRLAVAMLKGLGAGRNRLFELFPYGYLQQACKIAGMRKPRALATG